MAISFVSAGSGSGTTLTIPAGHQGGDLLLMWAFNDGTTTVPTLPSGWYNFANAGLNAAAARLAYKFATSSSETSGTWTNATHLSCMVYRGVATNGTPVAGGTVYNAVGANLTIQAVTVRAPSTSWLVTFVGHTQIDGAFETAPTSHTNRTNFVDAVGEVSGHDSNGIYGSGAYSSNTITGGGTSGTGTNITVELRADALPSIRRYLRPHPFSPGLAR